MTILTYLKDKLLYLSFWMTILLIISFVLDQYHVPLPYNILFCTTSLSPLLIWYSIEYIKKRNFYRNLQQDLDALDKKYLLHTIIEEAEFLEAQILCDVLYETNKSMMDEMNHYKKVQHEYKEYIETWVHEIKTPMTAARLLLRNKPEIKGLEEELDHIDSYVEEVLYYARSTNPEKDFLVRKMDIQDAINHVLQKNAKSFIQKGISLQMAPSEVFVYSDSKWVEFIINQIISNAIKYSQKPNAIISITVDKNEQYVTLCITDNGVGINEKDLSRVFEKGFTGENGRLFGKSTGVGLYLCKKIADKLYLGLTIDSKVNQGTSLQLVFPLNHSLILLDC